MTASTPQLQSAINSFLHKIIILENTPPQQIWYPRFVKLTYKKQVKIFYCWHIHHSTGTIQWGISNVGW